MRNVLVLRYNLFVGLVFVPSQLRSPMTYERIMRKTSLQLVMSIIADLSERLLQPVFCENQSKGL